MALRHERGPLGADGVHDGRHVFDPVLGRRRSASHRIGHPDAAHVEPDHTADARQCLEELLHQRLLPEHLEMTRPIQNENEVTLTGAEDLIRELDPAALRVLRARLGHPDRYKLPRSACSRSIASKSDLKFPIPNPREPCRSMTSKKSVGRSWTIFVKSCSR